MKTILIPIDFTKTSHHAIDYALQLFHNDEVNYILLNAFQVESGPNHNSYENEKSQHQANLDTETKSLKEKVNSKSNVTSILWLGKIDFLPHEIIEENKVDLVVMGTDGISDVEKYIGKSHAGEFVSHVDVNTLVIPVGVNYKIPQNILFTTNYKNVKELGTLETLQNLVNKYDSSLFVLYVNDTGSELTTYQKGVKQQLHDYFIKNKVSFHEFTADNIEHEIENFMSQYKIDLVSAIPQHNTFFDRLFHNSLAKKLTEYATIPVLILTNKK